MHPARSNIIPVIHSTPTMRFTILVLVIVVTLVGARPLNIVTADERALTLAERHVPRATGNEVRQSSGHISTWSAMMARYLGYDGAPVRRALKTHGEAAQAKARKG